MRNIKWILTSERLPADDAWVLVTTKEGLLELAYYNQEGGQLNDQTVY